MEPENLEQILQSIKNGELDTQDAKTQIQNLFFTDLGHTVLDTDRERRNGTPEVIYGENKSVQQILDIATKIVENGSNLLITRTKTSVFNALKKIYSTIEYDEIARTITLIQKKIPLSKGVVGVICAGTSDLYAAKEAMITAQFMGSKVKLISDVGVAGIHRLLNRSEEIRSFRVLIVAAGMEGALPSVVAGLVDKPVIALPTSVGYGANFGGVAPLLTMINSCANGIAVVNIDSGFNAGYMAALINRL